jgi:murein L,D-transpeptidase YcbB/YkuD
MGMDQQPFPCEHYIIQLSSTGPGVADYEFAKQVQSLDKEKLPDHVHYANTSDAASVDPASGAACTFFKSGGQWVLYADSFSGLDDACRTRLDRSPPGAIVKTTATYDDGHGISCLCPDSLDPPSLRPDPNPDPWVAELQSALAGLMNASITGDEDDREYFGAQTQNAVKDFQERHAITGEDGFVGPRTWAGLRAALQPSCAR